MGKRKFFEKCENPVTQIFAIFMEFENNLLTIHSQSSKQRNEFRMAMRKKFSLYDLLMKIKNLPESERSNRVNLEWFLLPLLFESNGYLEVVVQQDGFRLLMVVSERWIRRPEEVVERMVKGFELNEQKDEWMKICTICCLRGYAKSFVRGAYPGILKKMDWIQASCLGEIVRELMVFVCQVDEMDVYREFVSQCKSVVLRCEPWMALFSQRLPCQSVWSLKEVCLLIECIEGDCQKRCLEVLSSLWKQVSFIDHAPMKKQRHITNFLVLLLKRISGAEFEGLVSSNCIEGVQNRLGRLGKHHHVFASMMVEVTSELMGQKKTKLIDDDLSIENLENEFQKVHIFKETKTEEKVKVQPTNHIDKVLKKEKFDDPDALGLVDDESSEEDSDSDDSIESFNDEEQYQEIEPPRYVRDLIPLLTAKNDDRDLVDKIELALTHGSSLIRKIPDDLEQVAKDLLSLYLHVQDYNIPNFESMQQNCIISVLVIHVASVKYLVEEFYSRHCDLGKRMIILTCMKGAALELSNRHETKVTATKPKIIDLTQYPSETKRWGSMKTDSEAQINRFLPIVRQYFYPLIKDYDNPSNNFQLLGQDAFLLAKLLDTLAIFIHCCGNTLEGTEISITSLELVWVLHYASHFQQSSKPEIILPHQIPSKQAENQAKGTLSVRRSVLHLLLRAIMCLPSYILSGDHVGLIENIQQWLNSTYHDESDTLCREFCVGIASQLKKKLSNG